MAYPTSSASTRRTISDVLLYESNPNYCRESGEITAPAGGLDLQVGTLLVGGATPEPFDTEDVATVTGVLLTDVQLLEGETLPIAWSARGEGTLNQLEIDFPADATQTTNIKTTLKGLGFKLVDGLAG